MTTRTKARRKPRSDALAAIHETAEGLHRAGLMDRETMREFDALCLTPVEDSRPRRSGACASVSRSRSRCSRITSMSAKAS